jgi:acyl dehydratase
MPDPWKEAPVTTLVNDIRDLLGVESEAVTTEVSAMEIWRFAEAVGDTNPIYRDAAAADLGGPIAPLTFFTTIRSGDLPEPRFSFGHMSVAAGRDVEYFQPIRAGQKLVARSRYADAYERDGRSGRVLYYVIESLIEDERRTPVAAVRRIMARSDASRYSQKKVSKKVNNAMLASSAETRLPELRKSPVTRVQIARYACASGDFNPLHLDEQYAVELCGFKSVIAHGMLSMAFLAQMLTDWVGDPRCVRRLSVQFRGNVYPGDILVCRGEAAAPRPGESSRKLHCALQAVNQDGEMVTVGTAAIVTPDHSKSEF